MLLNRSRAHDVMRAHGLDGPASLVPHNVHYLSDFMALPMAAGFDAAVAAVPSCLHGLVKGLRDAGLAMAVTGAGFPGPFRAPAVQPLGLQHTDDPQGRFDPPGKTADRALEADMVINVDMPHLEIGWGAVHIEDTARVTGDGCEPLTSMDAALGM
jgi:hypothetical protein